MKLDIIRLFSLSFIDDHSRVILDKEEGDPDSDYINANYIDVSLKIRSICGDWVSAPLYLGCSFDVIDNATVY